MYVAVDQFWACGPFEDKADAEAAMNKHLRAMNPHSNDLYVSEVGYGTRFHTKRGRLLGRVIFLEKGA